MEQISQIVSPGTRVLVSGIVGIFVELLFDTAKSMLLIFLLKTESVFG